MFIHNTTDFKKNLPMNGLLWTIVWTFCHTFSFMNWLFELLAWFRLVVCVDHHLSLYWPSFDLLYNVHLLKTSESLGSENTDIDIESANESNKYGRMIQEFWHTDSGVKKLKDCR